MKSFWFSTIVAAPIVSLLLNAAPSAGPDKAMPWKPFISADAYKELTNRSVKAIEAAAKSDDKNAIAKIHVEAAILAGYTLGVADAKDHDVSVMRGAAIVAMRLAQDKEIKNLTTFAKITKGSVVAPADLKVLKPRLPALDDLMEIFRNKSKGGEGLHADLQYHPKLKNLNGIEALLGALAAKKLSDENLDKVAKELPNLANRIAVVGVLTHELAPAKGAEQWRDLSNKMRDASIALAEHAQTKNGAGIQKAAQSLESTCTQCHSAFKSK